jgi:ubiquinone/menaquinone biosynthesis C-methylase UbiE
MYNARSEIGMGDQASNAEKFAGRVMDDCATALRGTLAYIGDRLGIFRTMSTAGPITLRGLSARTQLDERYLREWLAGLVSGAYIEFDASSNTYFLPPEHAAVLVDENSPLFMGGLVQLLVPMTSMAPKVVEAFRTGYGVAIDEYPPDMFEGMERGSGPLFRNNLIQRWIPAATGIEASLRHGCSVVDVGCGCGVAAVLIAKAYPAASVRGYDQHAASIERARRNAADAGVADRVQFEIRDCTNLPTAEFDMALVLDVFHDSADPVQLLSAVRRSLRASGSCLLFEPFELSRNPAENMNSYAQLVYASTVLFCISVSKASGGIGIGADTGEEMIRNAALSSGFERCDRILESSPAEALFHLRV